MTRRTSLLLALATLAAASCAPARTPPAPPATPVADAPPHLQQGRWLRIIATNDFHGALEPRRDGAGVLRGGAAALAAEIARARGECVAPACASLLLDGGDQFQGTVLSNLAHGRPVVALFNRLGRAASALGNHEFDWGIDTLRARMRDARYPFLAANVADAQGADVAWIPDDTIVTAGPLRVGLVGIATEGTLAAVRADIVRGLRILPPAPVVDRHARALRARGADIVVVVAHAGAFCTAQAGCDGEIVTLARSLTEPIAAIVSGHTHSAVSTVVRGVPIVQARSNGTALGVVDVALDGAADPVVALRDVLPDRITPDPVVDSIVRAEAARIAPLVSRPIVDVAERMTPAVVGDLIADAQRAAGAGDVAVMNAGGVRAPIAAGTATYGSLFEVAPFGNRLVRLTLRGSVLRDWLERVVARRSIDAHLSGLVVRYDAARAAGSRITSVVMADGQPLDDAREYRLVMSDFLAGGGDGLAVSGRAERVENLGILDLDALIDWLRAQPAPVRGPANRRLVVAR